MKTSSQDSVKALFNLPIEEKVYDDFGCAYSDSILYHGRLFLTENYICFNSNILGLRNKCVIPIKEITEIKKKKILGIFNNSIEIKVKEDEKKKKNSYTFASFTNRDIAYKRIKLVCKSKMAVNAGKLERESIHTLGISKLSGTDESDDDERSSTLIGNNLNRSLNLSELNTSVDAEMEGKEEVYFPPIDPDKVYEVSKLVMNIQPGEFFEKFIKDGAEHSLDKFYSTEMEHTGVTVSEWKELDGQLGTMAREFNFVVKVKDVPFVSQSRVHKTQKFTREGDKITIHGSSSSMDVPYCTYFTIEDTWEIIPLENDKSVIRATVYANFVKSTMFKSSIVKATKAEFQKEFDKWIEFAKSKNYKVDNYHPSMSKRKSTKDCEEVLLHGLEKETVLQNLPRSKRWVLSVKNRIKDYYYRSRKDFFIVCALIFLFMWMIYLLKLLHYQNRLIENDHNMIINIAELLEKMSNASRVNYQNANEKQIAPALNESGL